MLVFYFNKLCWGFGLHSGDGGDVRERERERQKLERDINIFYWVNILF